MECIRGPYQSVIKNYVAKESIGGNHVQWSNPYLERMVAIAVVHRLSVLAVFKDNLGSVPRTHTAIYSYL